MPSLRFLVHNAHAVKLALRFPEATARHADVHAFGQEAVKLIEGIVGRHEKTRLVRVVNGPHRVRIIGAFDIRLGDRQPHHLDVRPDEKGRGLWFEHAPHPRS